MSSTASRRYAKALTELQENNPEIYRAIVGRVETYKLITADIRRQHKNGEWVIHTLEKKLKAAQQELDQLRSSQQ